MYHISILSSLIPDFTKSNTNRKMQQDNTRPLIHTPPLWYAFGWLQLRRITVHPNSFSSTIFHSYGWCFEWKTTANTNILTEHLQLILFPAKRREMLNYEWETTVNIKIPLTRQMQLILTQEKLSPTTDNINIPLTRHMKIIIWEGNVTYTHTHNTNWNLLTSCPTPGWLGGGRGQASSGS